jgi:Zn-dependent M28 family amino/carboxypeptidase
LVKEFARIGLSPVRDRFAFEWSARSSMNSRPRLLAAPHRNNTSLGTRSPSGDSVSMPPPPIFGVNLLGLVPGTVHPDRYIVVSAHYDHLGIEHGDIYHGADDNASGTAAILAIAEWTIAHPPQNSILFAWFDGEESGLVGSTEFVRSPAVPLEKIAADVNVDMVSRNVGAELFAAGARRYPVMQPLIDSLASVSLVALRQGHDGGSPTDDWTHRSDEGPFSDKGIPFIHFGVEEHRDYHEPTDTFEHIMPGFYYRSVRTIAEFVRLLDRSLDSVAEFRRARD